MALDIHSPDPETWNDLIERSPHATPFHRHEVLEVLAEHADASLRPLAGYKGQEPVGLFPVFLRSAGPVTVAFSPPPSLKVSYLGPALLNGQQLKVRTAERRHARFVEACLEELDAHGPRYVHVRTGSRYEDPRPFVFNGFAADPAYTYVVDLERDPDDLLAAFSSDARRNVRDGPPDRLTIAEGDAADARRVVEQVAARHAEQGEPYPLDPEFVVDLHDAAPPGVVRPYAARLDGEFVGGMVALAFGDTVYRWQGGAKHDRDVPVNDLLDWHIMRDAMDRGVARYDLVGANNPRICEYKAKFAPDLATYHSLTRAAPGMRTLADLYRRLR